MPDQAGAIALRYVVTADPAAILLPRTALPARLTAMAAALLRGLHCRLGQQAYGEFTFAIRPVGLAIALPTTGSATWHSPQRRAAHRGAAHGRWFPA